MLPEKWKEYLDKPLWPNRIVFYLILFIAVLSVFGIAIFIFKNLFSDFSIVSNTAYIQYNTTQLSDMGFFDNERYLLSALVQSLAAVIALVITLSLVAVQLAAQSYSARVIDVYKRNPDMWILLGVYIVTIFYGLGLIKIIGLGILRNYIESAIFGAYFMGFFAFICLVPYMWKTLDLLKPSTVIIVLAKEITKKKVIESLENYEEVNENDPIQPIIDIVNSALERNDYETVKNGLVTIKNSANQIIEKNTFEKREEWEFSGHLIEHIERLGKNAIKNSNEISTISNVKVIEEIGMKAADRNFEWTTWRAISTLHIFALEATQKDFGFATRTIISSVERIGIQSTKKKFELAPQECVITLEKIGIEQAQKEMDWDIGITANTITKFGFEDGSILPLCIRALRKIGLKTADFQLEDALLSVSDNLKQLGIEIDSDENQQVGIYVAMALRNIGIKAAERDISYPLYKIIEYIDNIGTVALKKEDKLTAGTSIRALGILREKSNRKEMLKIIDNYIEGLLETSTKMGWDIPSIIEELKKENYDAYNIVE